MSVLKESPLTLSKSEPEPDLAVVRGSRQDFRTAHPTTAELVIEVAVSTLEIDRRKAPIFAAAGVKEYWIVVPEERLIEVYRGPQDDGYAVQLTMNTPAVLKSATVPEVVLELEGLFRML